MPAGLTRDLPTRRRWPIATSTRESAADAGALHRRQQEVDGGGFEAQPAAKRNLAEAGSPRAVRRRRRRAPREPGRVLSPIDGRIVTLLDTSHVEVSAQMPAADVVRLKVGLPAPQSSSKASAIASSMVALLASAQPTQAGSTSIPVYVEITNWDHEALRGGLFGTERCCHRSGEGPRACGARRRIRKDERRRLCARGGE